VTNFILTLNLVLVLLFLIKLLKGYAQLKEKFELIHSLIIILGIFFFYFFTFIFNLDFNWNQIETPFLRVNFPSIFIGLIAGSFMSLFLGELKGLDNRPIKRILYKLPLFFVLIFYGIIINNQQNILIFLLLFISILLFFLAKSLKGKFPLLYRHFLMGSFFNILLFILISIFKQNQFWILGIFSTYFLMQLIQPFLLKRLLMEKIK
jgi:hypothetical protein